MTWEVLETFIGEILAREGKNVDSTLALSLGNAGLGEIALLSELLADSCWTNAAGGELTITDNKVLLPADCLFVERVEWDGKPLTRTQMRVMDHENPTWRTVRSANPGRYIPEATAVYLDCTPTGSVVGRLTFRGVATLPRFTNPTNPASNPMDQIPMDYEMLPAYYVLKYYPVDPEDGVQALRKATYSGLYDQGLAGLASLVKRRTGNRFDFS